MTRSRIVAAALAILLITAGVSGPASQPAAATHDCDELDALIAFATFTTVNGDKCTNNHVDHAIQEMKEADGQQTEMDIYSSATELSGNDEANGATFDNYLNDTESAAWMKAEIAIAQSYENETTESLARVRAKEAIADYYSVKAVNLIQQVNATVQELRYLSGVAQNESDVSGDFVHLRTHGDAPSSGDAYRIRGNVTTETVTLPNGTKQDVLAIPTHEGDDQDNNPVLSILNDDVTEFNGHSAPKDGWTGEIIVEAPNDNYEPIEAYDFSDDVSRWNQIQQQNDDLQAEVDPFVNSTWDSYQSGDINTSEVISRNNLMFNYGTEATGNESNLYNSVAALSTLGLDTPNLNGTGTMEVVYQNDTYHGLVMASEAPGGIWEVNTTYDASNIEGHTLLVTTEGERIQLDGEFTIAAISARDGSDMENVTAERVVYKTSNTSEQLEKMETLLEFREEVEAAEASSGGGSGSDSTPWTKIAAIGTIALVVFGALRQTGRRDR